MDKFLKIGRILVQIWIWMKYGQNVAEIWTEFGPNLDFVSVWMKCGQILDFIGRPTLASSAAEFDEHFEISLVWYNQVVKEENLSN